MSKNKHVHKFDKLVEQTILVSSGLKTAKDKLKQRKCKCGKLQTYDMERIYRD